jgi:hypothetical protein
MGCITCRMAVITPREFAGRNVDLVRHQWSRVLDVERDAVHDVRVALRRIRAATRTLSDASAKEIELCRVLGRALGRLRELDVTHELLREHRWSSTLKFWDDWRVSLAHAVDLTTVKLERAMTRASTLYMADVARAVRPGMTARTVRMAVRALPVAGLVALPIAAAQLVSAAPNPRSRADEAPAV